VTLQLDQVVEGVGAAQLAGMDQAHELITDLRAMKGAIKQCVLSSMEIFPYSKLCSLQNYAHI
jgi:hypothetical protein